MIMNKFTVVGRLGQKPVAEDANGKAIVKLSVAVPRQKAKGAEKAEADWIRFTVWDKPTVDYLVNYFDKGDEVYLEAHYRVKTVTGADGKKKEYGNFIVDSVQKVTWKATSAKPVSNSVDSGIEVDDLGLTGELPDFE